MMASLVPRLCRAWVRGYMMARYSQTSDSGPSEIGTQLYNKPLYKGRFSRSQIIGLPMVLIHFEPPRRGQPLRSTKDKRLEFIILFPKCPLFGGLTVYHIDWFLHKLLQYLIRSVLQLLKLSVNINVNNDRFHASLLDYSRYP